MRTRPGTHSDLHSEQAALPGERPGRAKSPVTKVVDSACLEFAESHLTASAHFAHSFGFATVTRTTDELL